MGTLTLGLFHNNWRPFAKAVKLKDDALALKLLVLN